MRLPPIAGWLPALSFAAALLLQLIEWPAAIEPIKPYWPALVLIFWLLESQERFGLGSAFLLGLIADSLVGSMLGEQALRLVVLAFIVTRFRSRLRFFPMWQQTLVVAGLLLNDRVLLLMVRAFGGASLPPAEYWFAPIGGAIAWPFVFLFLDAVRTHARAHD